MTRTSSRLLPRSEGVPPAEGRPILLRAYAEAKPATAKQAKLQRPSEWVLLFDCETTVDETQRLRFGTFQLWDGDKPEIQGLFFDPRPGSTSEAEQEVLKAEAELLGCRGPRDGSRAAHRGGGGVVSAGTVYLLPADGFAEQPPMRLGDQWVRTQQVATATPVRPAAKLSVEPADFPLLASIRGHDTRMRVTR